MTRQMNFLFTTWEGGGNVSPALEVARKLVARGHSVRVISEDCNRSEAEAAGAKFRGWRRAPNRKDRTRHSQTFKDWAAATPQQGLITVIRDHWCGPALAYAQDLREELDCEPADLVVTCEALFGVMAACESIGQRFVTLCPNISLSPLPGVPPLGPGLPPARTPQEKQMHKEIARAVQELFDSGLPSLNETRRALKLEPLEHLIDQLNAAYLELLATSQSFDFPADYLPGRVRYVGPQIADPVWAKPWADPWSKNDQRPLVTVGFSTTFQNHVQVMQNVIDALAEVAVRVLVTLGGSVDAEQLRCAENCVTVESAPHAVVMRQSAMVVTHGGHGTTMQALLSRVPMLVIPHGRDQNDNAARVTTRNAGLSLTPEASVEEIRSACLRILNEPEFKEAARRLGDQIAHEADNSTVVEELESAASALAPLINFVY